ncbi:hypothetical protein LCGC14_2362560 [marine sediment metagenome]|uniref:Uncharacterized protein n=1 Tax=marine sediment metagenome TaxID=412755 RepID=A0A0F9CTK7_9ZZZZ
MSDDKITRLPSMRSKGLPVARLLGEEIITRIENFVLDGLTGNVVLNFRDGKILGYRAEEVVSLKKN